LGSSSCRISLRVAVFRHPFLSYVTEYRQSAELFLQSSELGLPNPSPAGECALCAPPLVPGGGAHSLARERGWEGESQFRRGHTLYIYMYVLCVLHHASSGLTIDGSRSDPAFSSHAYPDRTWSF